MPATRRRLHQSTAVRRAILSHDFWARQAGGAVVEVNGAQYDYRAERNAGTRTIVIRGGRRAGRPECFLLFLEPDKSAELHGLEQAADCALSGDGSGRKMVAAAVKIARARGATRFVLTDLARKKTDSGKKFPLSNMYFLTTGQAWYESILPGLVPTSKIDKIPVWRERVRTNTWTAVLQGLRAQGVVVDDAASRGADVDVDAPGSAMTVLRRMKEAGTDFFADYDDEILIASGVGALHGVDWEMPL
jgi:hypothetical protein